MPGEALPDPAGKLRPLAEAWTAGPAVIAVGHSDCPTTRLALRYLERIHRRRAPGGTALVILQDEPEAALALAREMDLTLPLLLDRAPYRFAAAIGLEVAPTLMRVAPDGRVAAVVEGFERDGIGALAEALGVVPLFTPEDQAPRLRPG